MNNRECRRGFTLIELLVVIAIIAILAAILFPIFITAKAKAQQTKCLSNLKQIGNGFALYAQSNDDRFPTIFWTTQHPRLGAIWYPTQVNPNNKLWKDGWVSMVDPYIKNRASGTTNNSKQNISTVYFCPSSTAASGVTTGIVTNYTMNGALGYTSRDQYGRATYPNAGLKTSAVRNSSHTVMLNDGSNWDWGRTWGPGDTGYYLPTGAQGKDAGDKTTQTYLENKFTPIHNKGANIFWVDGHASWISIGQVKPSLWWYTGTP
ncbi:MAG: prepilin-type N-terminal cleavage/methylation domain-containing protein [Armatimonadota bacterium]|nr:prepilin-type N-terminal cleavage/methylation domain-containing protein [bacterium]